MNRLALWLAQGFSVGRIPIGPGTFGSVLGLAWFAALLETGRAWGFALGCLFGLAMSVWACGRAERILKVTDPGSVVLDEIAALPVCFVAWLALSAAPGHGLPALSFFLKHPNWIGFVLVFAAFRVFDILKPWPVRQSQGLPGGWGVTVDDLLAAAYVNVVTLCVWPLVRS